MDGPKGITVSEVSQTSKKQIYGFAYMCNLKNQMTNQTKTETHKPPEDWWFPEAGCERGWVK